MLFACRLPAFLPSYIDGPLRSSLFLIQDPGAASVNRVRFTLSSAKDTSVSMFCMTACMHSAIEPFWKPASL